MNHTPTPWDLRSSSITVKDNGEDIVAEANGGLSGTIGEAVANAAFIVQACNAHEALVDALETAEGFRHSSPETWYPAVAAALKLAKGE